MTDTHLLAGRFGAAVRLSPKALRLYAEQGLLAPAYVDPATGYRYYASSQIPRARLIARLRQLGLPLARVAEFIDLAPDARLAELRAWLRSEAERLADRTELVEALARQAKDTPELTAKIRLRGVAASKIVYRQEAVTLAGLDDFLNRAEADIRAHLRDSGVGIATSLRLYFHEEVGRGGEGLVEAAIAYQGSLEPKGDLRLRYAAAYREAYLPVPAAETEFPLVLRIYDALEAWLAGAAGLAVLGSPCEVYPGSAGTRFDVAYPVNL